MVTKRQSVPLDWYDDEAEEVPNPSLPDARRLERRQVWTRRYVKASVILCPLFFLAAIASITHGQHSSATASVDSPGRVAATVTIDKWLAERPSPLPGATLLAYDGAHAVALSKTERKSHVRWTIETFTLVARPTSTDPSFWTVGVEVEQKPSGVAMSISGPAFLPTSAVQASSALQADPWPGHTATSSVSGTVQSVINDWLSAYTSGNDSELHLAVGDPDPKHVYLALHGVRSASDSVVAAAQVGKPGSGELIAEVELDLLWQHERQPVATPTTSAPQGPQTTMDLLIAHATSAAPVVVAWGPPGSGPSLRPYENALGA